MRLFFLNAFIFYVGLIYSQSSLDDYNHFTPERRLVLSKMGEFFDETIRKNFPADTDSLSYLYFHKCYWQTGAEGFHIVLDIDRAKLKEINQVLFKDYNYYFFYARYIYMGEYIPWQARPPAPVDSVPTLRTFSSNGKGYTRKKYITVPVLNMNGYIKVMPDDNPVIRMVKENIAEAGDLTPGSIAIHLMGNEVSQPQVKQYLAVIYWKYLCFLGGIDLEDRKSVCETCDF